MRAHEGNLCQHSGLEAAGLASTLKPARLKAGKSHQSTFAGSRPQCNWDKCMRTVQIAASQLADLPLDQADGRQDPAGWRKLLLRTRHLTSRRCLSPQQMPHLRKHCSALAQSDCCSRPRTCSCTSTTNPKHKHPTAKATISSPPMMPCSEASSTTQPSKPHTIGARK